MRIATFNINNVNKRLANLLDWLATAQPDVVCLRPEPRLGVRPGARNGQAPRDTGWPLLRRSRSALADGQSRPPRP